ncbi:hypothetical protein AB0M02_02560 [Actinoplanes sp. NPDC051861]|uniref:hypothetical protein n=1 Tax=Actinoplanes sp. NPDC051861 TaxID=3155170 RepID=UPI003430AE80
MRKFTKRSAAFVTAGVIAVTGAGAAYAAWLLSGTGSAAATAGSAAQLSVSGITVTPAFGPGSTNDVAFTVTNTNAFPAEITSVSIGTITNAVADTVCADNNVVANEDADQPASLPTLGAAGSATDEATITFDDALKMIADPQNGCQGVNFTIPVTVAAVSAAS